MSGNNRGKKQGGRGRGRGRGGGGRGQSRGGGGRGRNRELIPSSVGFLYRPRSNVDEYDDFKVYGQFSSDDDEEEQTIKYPHGAKSKKKNQKNKKKNNLGFIRESTPSLGASYDDDVEERPGLGLASSSSSGSGGHRQKEQRFANGKSKYFKTVAFTRSSSTLNLDQASTTVSETETSQVVTMETAESSSTNVVTQQLSELKIEETQVLNVDQVTQVEAAITAKPEELEPVNVKGKEPQEVVLDSNRNDEKEEQEEDDDDEDEGEDNLQFNGQDDYQEEEDDDDEDDDDDDSDDEDITEFYPDEDDEDDDDDDDELLLEDMMIMSDYIENIEGNVEDLNELLVWSQMQDGLELLESEFSYSDLDAPPPQVNKSKNKKKKKNNADDRWKNDFDDEEEFILRDSADAFVDPEIFEQTMRNALSEVPPSLKPGMRRWFEKQQKKELRKKKKEEEKARRKKEQEKAAKGKGKGKNKYSDSDLTTQMTKIDDRMRDFINDNTITSFQFAPMSKYIRKEVHLLAKVYNLKSESVGSSANRATIITKTETSRIPRDRKTLDRYLINVQNNLDDQFRIQQKRNNYSFSINSKRGGSSSNNNNYKKGGNRSKSTSSTANNNNNSSGSGSSTAPRHGTIVGQGVAPINESNVGHRMLAAMGWRQGDALGAKNEGIIAPIEAVIRKKGLGLGS